MELVLVAIVGVIGTVISWFLARLDKRNTQQHGENLGVLTESRDATTRVEAKVDTVVNELQRLSHRVDAHIDWHAHQAPSQPSVQSVVVNPPQENAA